MEHTTAATAASKTQHTPGPWSVGNKTPLWPTFTVYSRPFGLGDVAEVHSEADADLIAAAPNLLAALQAIVRSAEINQAAINTFLVLDAREAIAKATGSAA